MATTTGTRQHDSLLERVAALEEELTRLWATWGTTARAGLPPDPAGRASPFAIRTHVAADAPADETAARRSSRSGLLRTIVGALAGMVGAGVMLATQTGTALAETEASPEVTPNVVVTGPAPASGIGVDVSTQGASGPLFTTAITTLGSKVGVSASHSGSGFAVEGLNQYRGSIGVFGHCLVWGGDGVHRECTGAIAFTARPMHSRTMHWAWLESWARGSIVWRDRAHSKRYESVRRCLRPSWCLW